MVIVAILLAFLVVSTTFSGEIIVAHNIPDGQQSSNVWESVALIALLWNASENNAKGQFFTPSTSGTLTTIQAIIAAGIYQRVDGSPPLDVSIYSAQAGIPETKLGTRTFIDSDFYPAIGSDDHLVTIDFSSFGIEFIAGNGYMVVYESPYGILGEDDGDAPYLIGRLWNPPISLGGSYSLARNGVDWEMVELASPHTFQLATSVGVIPIPEPASDILALMCLVLSVFPCSVYRA